MNSICKYLLAENRIEKHFQYQARVRRSASQLWSISHLHQDKATYEDQDAKLFDYVVMADRNSARADRKDFDDAIRSFASLTRTHVTSRPVLVAMVALNKPLPEELGDIVSFIGDGVIAQAIRDSAKPQRTREDGLECWVLQSTHSHAQNIIRYRSFVNLRPLDFNRKLYR